MTFLLRYIPLITLFNHFWILVYSLQDGPREQHQLFFTVISFGFLYFGLMISRYRALPFKTISVLIFMAVTLAPAHALTLPSTYGSPAKATLVIAQLLFCITSIYAIVKNEGLALPRLMFSKLNLILFTVASTYVSGFVLAFMAKELNIYTIILTVALFSSMPLVKAISERKSWAMVSQFLISIVLLVPFITYMYVNPLFFKEPVAIPIFLLFTSAALALSSLVRPERSK
ncbi:hypothetical protein [Salidesulfovibrio brasiliensis]